MRRSGEGNNLLSLTDESSMERSFSRLTVLAQGHAHSTNNKKELGIIDVSSSDSLTVSGDTDTTETELDTGLPRPASMVCSLLWRIQPSRITGRRWSSCTMPMTLNRFAIAPAK
ncbi:Uncharacterised protein [Klebsiella pneumoniae]|uniref:Uncharacterized protein n=1 Tax=Klebsiella pneumoniae TaxID=573 RepID=A0A2X3KQK7_KLEPN|nr:Uncharacterised protein [Klebsiella pneumoniae]